MDRKGRVRLLKVVVWLLGLTPFGWLSYRFFLVDGLGANPITEFEHWAGLSALTALLVTLSITPIRRLTGFHDLQKVRRLTGLFAFFYLALHFSIWLGLDQFPLEWQYVSEDITERPFILVGFSAFVLLIPLAVTSTKRSIRRLGRKWVQLHRLVYLVVPMGVVHYFWATKLDNRGPTLAAVVLSVLLGSRIWWALKRRRRVPSSAKREPAVPAATS